MKQSGFKKPTYKEALKKQREKQKKAIQRKPRKAVKKRTRSKKQPSIRLLKKKLWAECKRITRERYGNTCFTCGKRGLEGSGWQTGHFISSSICSVEMRYSLDNLRPQCYNCNINKSGNWVAYEKRLKSCGIDVEEMKQRNEDTKNLQYDSLWYLNKIEEYRQL